MGKVKKCLYQGITCVFHDAFFQPVFHVVVFYLELGWKKGLVLFWNRFSVQFGAVLFYVNIYLGIMSTAEYIKNIVKKNIGKLDCLFLIVNAWICSVFRISCFFISLFCDRWIYGYVKRVAIFILQVISNVPKYHFFFNSNNICKSV